MNLRPRITHAKIERNIKLRNHMSREIHGGCNKDKSLGCRRMVIENQRQIEGAQKGIWTLFLGKSIHW